MRSWSFGLLLGMFFSFEVGAQSYRGDSWEQVNLTKQGTITLAYVETPSFVYHPNSGRLSGICVDIMNDFIAYVGKTKDLKLEVKWAGEGADFMGMYNKVRNSSGGVFGMGNITITEGRKKEVKFSPPFISNFAILVTHSTVPMITRLEDLSRHFTKLNAYTVQGALSDFRMQEIKQKYFRGMKIIYTASTLETLDRVASDPNSFAYVDLAFYLHAVKDGMAIKRHPASDKLAEQFGLAMPLDSDWAPVIEEFFKANGGYTNTARYTQILRRHLGETGIKLMQTSLE